MAPKDCLAPSGIQILNLETWKKYATKIKAFTTRANPKGLGL